MTISVILPGHGHMPEIVIVPEKDNGTVWEWYRLHRNTTKDEVNDSSASR